MIVFDLSVDHILWLRSRYEELSVSRERPDVESHNLSKRLLSHEETAPNHDACSSLKPNSSGSLSCGMATDEKPLEIPRLRGKK